MAKHTARDESVTATTPARQPQPKPELVDAIDAVRATRVKALREQIQDGTYRPDARDIARRMLERGFWRPSPGPAGPQPPR